MSDITAWPWPRIIVGNYKLFLVTGSPGGNLTLSELFHSSAGYWGAFPVLSLGAYADIREVSIADFGPFYVVCTLGLDALAQPVRQTFVRNLAVANGFANAAFTTQLNPEFGVCCNFNGQFIGANAVGSGNWADLSSRSLAWSAIGNFTLNPEQSVEAGSMTSIGQWPARNAVQVYAVRQLGKQIAVYTDAGLVLASPSMVGNAFTYGSERVHGVGVASGNHVAGDDSLHGFIDLNAEFWTLDNSGKLSRRGYKEFLRTMLDFTSGNDTRTILSYTANEQTFCASNGNTCVVINRYGAYMTHQRVASMVQAPNGTIVGTFSTGTDTEARITSDSLDFGSRGIKSVESLLADVSHPSGASMWLSVDWRKDKGAAYQSRPWTVAGPIGRSVIHTAALDFRLRARFSSFTNVELFGLLANVKYSDQRFKRGTVPAQYEVGTA